ncbi:MAG: hypothetical protein P1V97_26110 [Planctomycetota bacterium]|nr:hypothetical protein [Planctomycetota bacterium]
MNPGLSSSQSRFQVGASPTLSQTESADLNTFFAAYRAHLRDHIPAQPAHHQIDGIKSEDLAAFQKRGFDTSALNALARQMSWPELLLEAGASKDACLFYNENGRSGALRDAVWDRYDALLGQFEAIHSALTLNTDEVEDIDVFVVAGHAGANRGALTAQLMLKNTKRAWAITTGDKANYMGALSFSMTEAHATGLSILRGGEGQICPGQILLEEESRITSHHGAKVFSLLELLAEREQRALRVGAVTSSFHSLRYVTGLDRALASAAFVKTIVPFSYWALVENKTRVGHILNEYVKILYQLCARDLSKRPY